MGEHIHAKETINAELTMLTFLFVKQAQARHQIPRLYRRKLALDLESPLERGDLHGRYL